MTRQSAFFIRDPSDGSVGRQEPRGYFDLDDAVRNCRSLSYSCGHEFEVVMGFIHFESEPLFLGFQKRCQPPMEPSTKD